MTSLKNTNDTEHTVEEIGLNQNLRFSRSSEKGKQPYSLISGPQ